MLCSRALPHWFTEAKSPGFRTAPKVYIRSRALSGISATLWWTIRFALWVPTPALPNVYVRLRHDRKPPFSTEYTPSQALNTVLGMGRCA